MKTLSVETIDTAKPNADDQSGVAVIVDGRIVAWFAELNTAAEQWCTENYFGTWLTLGATPPEIVPLSEQEQLAIERAAQDLCEAMGVTHSDQEFHN